MTIFSIPDMSCGHCKTSVETAILKLDPRATVTVDLPNRRADVTSSQPDDAVLKSLDAVGFPAQAI